MSTTTQRGQIDPATYTMLERLATATATPQVQCTEARPRVRIARQHTVSAGPAREEQPLADRDLALLPRSAEHRDRCQHTSAPLVLAYVQIDTPSNVRDSAAGTPTTTAPASNRSEASSRASAITCAATT